MKQRWRPKASENAIKRTIVLNDELWEWARDQPEGATGLIRRLLEQEHHAQATRRVLSVMTTAGEMQAVSDDQGMILLLEDDAVLYWSVEKGQTVPVMKIPALKGQVASIILKSNQIITIPLEQGQMISIPTSVDTLKKRMAKASERQEQQNSSNALVDGGKGSEENEEADGQ